MSLISAKNLVAPIRNKVNLVTILLITIAFGVLRFSGGDVKITSKKNYYRTKGYSKTVEPSTSNKNYFYKSDKKIIEPDSINNSRKDNKKSNSQSLIDIEKELGL